MRWPGRLPAGERFGQCVSLVDVTATLLAAAQAPLGCDGRSLLPLVRSGAPRWRDEAFAEHNAHGTDRPRAMLRQGNLKLCCTAAPAQPAAGFRADPGAGEELELYDLSEDPGEFTNLADHPAYAKTRNAMRERLGELWQPGEIYRRVLASQRERVLIRRVAPKPVLF
jgi:choline-sulfatase